MTDSMLTFYRNLPWFKESVKKIFVSPIKLPENFYIKNFEQKISGETFYPTTNVYFRFRAQNEISFDEHGIVTAKDESGEEFVFKQAAMLKNGEMFVLTKKMYQLEKKYIEDFKNSGIDIEKLKRFKVTQPLLSVANKILSENKNMTKNYTNNLVEAFAQHSDTAYNFAIKVAQFNSALKLNDEFVHKINVESLSPELLQFLTDRRVLFGQYYLTDYQKESIDNTIEDSAINMLIYAEKFFPAIKTHQAKTTEPDKNSGLANYDFSVKSYCANLSDVKAVGEEDLVFFQKPQTDQMFCYNIYDLEAQFSEGNYTNPFDSEEKFSNEFVKKVSTLTKTLPKKTTEMFKLMKGKRSLSPAEQSRFENLLEKVWLEVNKIKTTKEIGCEICKQTIESSSMLTTITTNGEIVSLCSKECFDKV